MNDELIKELAEEQLGDDPFYSKPCEEAIKKALNIEREKIADFVEGYVVGHYDLGDLIRNGEYE